MSKGKMLISIISVLLLLGLSGFIGYNLGQKQATIVLNDKKAHIDELTEHEKMLNEKIDTATSAHNELVDEVNAAYDEMSEYEEATGDLDEVVAKKTKQENKITKLKDRNDELQTEIDSKKKELASLTGTIKQVQAKPITLPGGNFTVGEDLPEGRYKISTTASSMNYFVNDGEVNIILGTESGFAEPTYTLDLYKGDKIEQGSSVTYTKN